MIQYSSREFLQKIRWTIICSKYELKNKKKHKLKLPDLYSFKGPDLFVQNKRGGFHMALIKVTPTKWVMLAQHGTRDT